MGSMSSNSKQCTNSRICMLSRRTSSTTLYEVTSMVIMTLISTILYTSLLPVDTSTAIRASICLLNPLHDSITGSNPREVKSQSSHSSSCLLQHTHTPLRH